MAVLAIFAVSAAAPLPLGAEEANWIWSPEHEPGAVPSGPCFFRKTFRLTSPEQGTVQILADDAYELFLNGRRLGSGSGTDQLIEYDITRYLARNNVLSVRVNNTRGSTAAVAARVMIKQSDGAWESYSTDDSWKASLMTLPLWNTLVYNDARWPAAQVLGVLGETPPWDMREQPTAEEGNIRTERFKIHPEFTVDELLVGDTIGSLIALTFNEFGHIIASREDGGLLLIYDGDDNGTPESVRPYGDIVKNCQGILALNGDVFVTGQGAEGPGLYRLSDGDRDGTLESARLLVKFNDYVGEHGAHGLTLGPDGLIYVSLGNYAAVDQVDPASPYAKPYEGDLNQPRYEDPSGHGLGLQAPGGTIIRTDIEGKKVERFAGGLRNAYDLAFNREGDLFIHDSDEESDMGMTWYRPTRLYHVTAGSDVGWRSGWAKWPDYFVDVQPPLLDTGRGSPTGLTVYNHLAFPADFHGAIFTCDWARGEILVVRLERSGASYAAQSEVFLSGTPLNVTDIDVGADGGLYFATGGRGTAGGVYRISWKGTVPDAVKDLGTGITSVIRQPQATAAFGRQIIAGLKKEIGDDWPRQIAGVARSTSNPWYYRLRAMDLMHLYGPTPSAALLGQLSRDSNELVRGKAAELMGLYPDTETHLRLLEMLDDDDAGVRRRACEALLRSGQETTLEHLRPMLASTDRAAAAAARRLLARQERPGWQNAVLKASDHREFIQVSLALLEASPDAEAAGSILSRIREFQKEFVTDNNFIDLLRVAQVAIHRAQLPPEELADFAQSLAPEYPSGNEQINRELVRLLAYLNTDEPIERYLATLASHADGLEKLHLALHLRYVTGDWPEGGQQQVLHAFQEARQREGGGSYQAFINNVERDFAKSFTADVSLAVLARGKEWPNAALGALYALPPVLDDETFRLLRQLDLDLQHDRGEVTTQLRTGLVAVFARSGDPRSLQYLRETWDREPERRETVAIGLAQYPTGENFDYLLKTLPIAEGALAQELLKALAGSEQTPEDPEHVRQVILHGLRLDKDAEPALVLLRKWTGEQPDAEAESPTAAIAKWKSWFAELFPEFPVPELPVAAEGAKWKLEEVLTHLNSETGAAGSAVNGAALFRRAQCIKCHRMGDAGESLGPDLTAVGKRFTKKEILTSILHPSLVISDQFAAKRVTTTDGRTLTGILGAGANDERVLLALDGAKTVLTPAEIESIEPHNVSAMPAGLLNELTLEEVSDLFAYLGVLPSRSVARNAVDDESAAPLR